MTPLGAALHFGDGLRAGKFSIFFAVAWPLYVILSFLLLVAGAWLQRTNSLSWLGHFLEDPRRSNDLLVLLSRWLCPVAGATLVVGHAQDIVDVCSTFLLGFFVVYLPLLDEPSQQLVNLWVGLGGLAILRLLHLHLANGALDIEASGFLLRVLLSEILIFLTASFRMRCLSRNQVPLTSTVLEGRGELQWPKKRPSQQHGPVDYMLDRQTGLAAAIVRDVWARRQQYKAELTGCFLWALHLRAQRPFLTSDLLMHILSFLQVLHPAKRTGTFATSAESQASQASQVSESWRSWARQPSLSSSMSSATLLRRSLPSRLLRHLDSGSPETSPDAQEAQEGRQEPNDSQKPERDLLSLVNLVAALVLIVILSWLGLGMLHLGEVEWAGTSLTAFRTSQRAHLPGEEHKREG